MEVEFSTSSGCFGASERRRETSTTGGVEEKEWKHQMEELFEEAYNKLVDSGHLEGELACGHLNGEWMSLESDGYVGDVGGDNDEKYEEDLDSSIAEASPATCESDPMFGMSFANVNIERIFLYFHYEFVKRDFG